MKAVLLIDFGSTYTKMTAVDIDNDEIIAVASSETTVDTNIMEGYYKAFEKIEKQTEDTEIEYVEKLACSSAAGGLKMISIGLVQNLTSEAAKRAALGAGSKVYKTYSHELSCREIKDIVEEKPDIILLAGGTDGGNKSCIVKNAELLSGEIGDIPIVLSGNKNAVDHIENVFDEKGIYYKITENVMPRLNVLNVEPAREAIRDVFMEKIIDAKGLGEAEKEIDNIMMPTPTAVLKAVNLLADGTNEEEGIGEILVVDIGGATTDVHSISKGYPTKSGVVFKGLQEPYAKRTVEGDLGMRESAISLYESAGFVKMKKFMEGECIDIKKRCEYLSRNRGLIPQTEEDMIVDETICTTAVGMAIERHIGVMTAEYTPMGVVYSQEGKDLTETGYVLGTGGAIVKSRNPGKILRSGLESIGDQKYLKPEKPEYLLDRDYILSAMGLLSERYPNKALKLLKKHIVNIG
ncbi:conserved hypothetical protein [Dethiosulfatibacter aminovorans DSM 17477]|uniref:MutL protein n=1 Tax=Dethiosulfatibacter aminovorans DSM 17477 TaxID=1121476 RepID=A0A1M6FM15_9FIRM|nr:methylaspartate mutase accessory protein GlmL [Dethiosulfatibacter aminovorans]SHI98649.1 conserved hypothetical protein [Dethiosulfatibacter aminovorans DSM 17477]